MIAEHIVAEAYQAGFSYDSEHVYSTFLTQSSLQNKFKSANSVAFENDAYEVKDKDGNYFYRNVCEKGLSFYDSQIAQNRREVENILKQYLSCGDFNFSEVLQQQIKEFPSQQFFRPPKQLRKGRTEFVEILKCFTSEFDETKAHAEFQKLFLPRASISSGKLEQSVQQTLFPKTIYQALENFNISIGYTLNDVIITSDRPIVVNNFEYTLFSVKMDRLSFPLTSRIIVFLSPEPSRIFLLSEPEIIAHNNEVAQQANLQIISHGPLSEDDIERYKHLHKQHTLQIQLHSEERRTPTAFSLSQLESLRVLKITKSPNIDAQLSIVVMPNELFLQEFIQVYIDVILLTFSTDEILDSVELPIIPNVSITEQQDFVLVFKANDYQKNLTIIRECISLQMKKLKEVQ